MTYQRDVKQTLFFVTQNYFRRVSQLQSINIRTSGKREVKWVSCLSVVRLSSVHLKHNMPSLRLHICTCIWVLTGESQPVGCGVWFSPVSQVAIFIYSLSSITAAPGGLWSKRSFFQRWPVCQQPPGGRWWAQPGGGWRCRAGRRQWSGAAWRCAGGRGEPSLFTCHDTLINMAGDDVSYRKSDRWLGSSWWKELTFNKIFDYDSYLFL